MLGRDPITVQSNHPPQQPPHMPPPPTDRQTHPAPDVLEVGNLALDVGLVLLRQRHPPKLLALGLGGALQRGGQLVAAGPQAAVVAFRWVRGWKGGSKEVDGRWLYVIYVIRPSCPRPPTRPNKHAPATSSNVPPSAMMQAPVSVAESTMASGSSDSAYTSASASVSRPSASVLRTSIV